MGKGAWACAVHRSVMDDNDDDDDDNLPKSCDLTENMSLPFSKEGTNMSYKLRLNRRIANPKCGKTNRFLNELSSAWWSAK